MLWGILLAVFVPSEPRNDTIPFAYTAAAINLVAELSKFPANRMLIVYDTASFRKLVGLEPSQLVLLAPTLSSRIRLAPAAALRSCNAEAARQICTDTEGFRSVGIKTAKWEGATLKVIVETGQMSATRTQWHSNRFYIDVRMGVDGRVSAALDKIISGS